jgi:hypothetical protein
MNITEVYFNLCWYDPRNPLYVEDSEDPIPPRVNCFCDNCFYGRDALALEIIRLNDFIRDSIKRAYE